MTFVSFEFFLCFCLLLAILRFEKKEQYRQITILIANILFYAYFDYRFLLVLLFQILVAYVSVKGIGKRRSQAYESIGIIVLLFTLGLFKYFNFFLASFSRLLSIDNGYALRLILPVGLSFYTFQAISYVIDVYRDKVEPVSLFKLSLYISFFPNIVSGPIVKSYKFLGQLEQKHEIELHNISAGAQIILLGIIKKCVIADRLAIYVNAIYNAPAAYNWISVLLAVLAYSLQIYCDFSGYSDMAIGIAKILGYDLGRNFNVPYLAENPSDFWGRWHISLSSWFKEYLYFPLGGNRKGNIRTYFNLFIVMVVSGLWHGASWTFVLWGVYHGIGSVIHRFVNKKLTIKTIPVINILITYVFVTIGWIFFRAESIGKAFAIMKRIITFSPGVNFISIYAVIYLLLLLIVMVYVAIAKNKEASYVLLDMSKFSSQLLFWLVVFLCLMFFYPGSNAFIYGQF